MRVKVNPSRIRPSNRVPTESNKAPSLQIKSYLPPVAGVVSNIATTQPAPNSAHILENFWPTARGIEPRGGTMLRVFIPNKVERMFSYNVPGSEKYFIADTNNIYSFTPSTADGTGLTMPDVTGQTNADYSFLEFSNDAGSFLIVVNGEDEMQLYNGSSWQQVNASSSPISLTGVQTNNLSHVWAYRERVFFIEKGTMDAWYLGTNSIGGAANRLPLAGLFNKGGSLLFGGVISSDSGEGMDDRCVFVTDRGEVAIFTGDNPADINSWSRAGVYFLGEPLGKDCHIVVGGDLIIGTREGLIPLSAAMHKDVMQLKLSSLSINIEPDWKYSGILSGSASDWRIARWGSRDSLVVSPPNQSSGDSYAWAANLQTNAWTKIVGWSISDLAVLGDNLMYGDFMGNVYLCDIGGQDDGNSFECRVCFSFDDMGNPSTYKQARNLKVVWKNTVDFNPKYSIAKDYKDSFGAAPSVPNNPSEVEGAWDTTSWDQAYWASTQSVYSIREDIKTIAGNGNALAVQIQITSGQAAKLDCELINVDLGFKTGIPLRR